MLAFGRTLIYVVEIEIVRYLLTHPVKAWLTVWLARLVVMQRQPTSICAALAPADACAA